MTVSNICSTYLKVNVVDEGLPDLGGAVAGGDGRLAHGVGAPVERQLDNPVDGRQLNNNSLRNVHLGIWGLKQMTLLIEVL